MTRWLPLRFFGSGHRLGVQPRDPQLLTGNPHFFQLALALHKRIKAEAMSRGLICYPMGGTIDGERGNHVLLAPPFIIDDGHVGEIAGRLGDSVEAVLSGIG